MTAAARFGATCRPRVRPARAGHLAAAPVPAVDLIAPTVIGTLPTPGATAVPSDARMVARFSEPLAADGIGAGSVRLVGAGAGGQVPATVVLSADGHEVTVAPQAPLDPATRYEVTIASEVVDLAGNGLGASYTWSFTIAPVTTRTQVATGAMLGVGHNPRWLYVSVSGGPWGPTYADGNPAAHGKLMNFRAANAIYDDENRALVPGFDPDVNTDEFIRWIPTYRALGILGFTISLQGGKPGYEGNVSSAFRPDGSLKPEWLDRAERVIRAADAQGMVVILTYFYKIQEPRLAGDEALRRGTRDATDWLIARGFGNAIIDIANEYDTSGYRHPIFTADKGNGGVAELIRLAQSRFAGRGYRLPVGASHSGLKVPPKIAAVSDLTLVHGNPHPPAEDGAMVAALVADPSVPGPVVVNEDFNGFGASEANVQAERQSAGNVFRAGGSWGLMWQTYNQMYPFRWAVGPSDDVSAKDQANRFRAVLDYMGALTAPGAPPP
jgi:hypothetical protein